MDSVQRGYVTSAPLAVRIATHRDYTVPQLDLVSWVLAHVGWRGDERVLDVGSGNGSYACAIRRCAAQYIALDFSPGMLRGGEGSCVRGDAARLPFAERSFDVVLANHMLYHVADPAVAIGQCARVLRPGGVLLAATNSASSLAEMRGVQQAAAARRGVDYVPPTPPDSTFSLENGGALLAPAFRAVRRHDVAACLVFREPRPAVAYIDSTRAAYEGTLPSGFAWADLLAAVEAEIEARIARDGAFRVPKTTGAFVCRRPVH